MLPILVQASLIHSTCACDRWLWTAAWLRDYHFLLNEQGAQIFTTTDGIAERVRKVGGSTIRSVQHVIHLARLAGNDADFCRAVTDARRASQRQRAAGRLHARRAFCLRRLRRCGKYAPARKLDRRSRTARLVPLRMPAQGLICRNACWIERQLEDDPIEWTNEEASRAKPISQRASHHRSNRRLAQDLCDAGRGADLKVPPREVALDASSGERRSWSTIRPGPAPRPLPEILPSASYRASDLVLWHIPAIRFGRAPRFERRVRIGLFCCRISSPRALC
jgi:hypothetical protein